MNEKIEEFVEKCTRKVTRLSPGGSYEETSYHFDKEKFAKLIVQEVINELETSKNADPYTGEVFTSERNTVLDEQIDWLKDYFGIKE